ncbi:hypothetical protein BCR44DRAFT_1190380 [Catenaria anguillulae PL171]|uniref:Uncharacterized protein n=1 Tax=Catenaria anguillulae PL171 TaxID=765915 RepID=A0A1Y2HGM9_9FUNG|nr:hypothetical protein BCR44DRAFT_1190380 [Catenaria anguillulae PL171]
MRASWDANTLQPLNATRNSTSIPHPIPLRSDAFAIHCPPHPSLLLAGQRDGWLSLIDLRTPSSTRSAASHPPPAAIASKPKHTYDHRPTHLPTWSVSSILTDTFGSTYCVFRGGHVTEYIPGYGQRMVHVAEEALDGESGFEVAMRQCAAGWILWAEVWCVRGRRGKRRVGVFVGGKKVAEMESKADMDCGSVASALIVVESEVTGRPMVVSVSTSS